MKMIKPGLIIVGIVLLGLACLYSIVGIGTIREFGDTSFILPVAIMSILGIAMCIGGILFKKPAIKPTPLIRPQPVRPPIPQPVAVKKEPIHQAGAKFILNKNKYIRHGKTIEHLAISANGEVLISADDQGSIRAWNTGDAKEISHVQATGQKISCLSITPDGRYAVAGVAGQKGEGGDLEIFHILDGVLVKRADFHTRWVYDVKFSSNGKLAASTGLDWMIKIWDFEAGKLLLAANHPDAGAAVCFQRGNKRVVSVSRDWTIKVWEFSRFFDAQDDFDTMDAWRRASERACVASWDGGPGIHSVAISGNGLHVAIKGGSTEEGIIVHASSGKKAYRWESMGRLQALYSGPDESLVIWEKSGNAMLAIDAKSGEQIQKIECQAENVKKLVVSPIGDLVVSGGEDGSIGIWKAVID